MGAWVGGAIAQMESVPSVANVYRVATILASVWTCHLVPRRPLCVATRPTATPLKDAECAARIQEVGP